MMHLKTRLPCIFHHMIFLSGLYAALARLMFWARAKPVLLLRVKYREMEFRFQIFILEGPALNSGDAFSLHTSDYIWFAWIAEYCFSLSKGFRSYLSRLCQDLHDCDGFLNKAILLFSGHAHPHKTIQSPVATGPSWEWVETFCSLSVLVPVGMARLKALFKRNAGARHQFLQGHRIVALIHQ